MSENRKRLKQVTKKVDTVICNEIYNFSDKYNGTIGVIDSDNPYIVPVYNNGKLIGYFFFDEDYF